jgi:hypothetical protein
MCDMNDWPLACLGGGGGRRAPPPPPAGFAPFSASLAAFARRAVSCATARLPPIKSGWFVLM